jgi:hypothetical protein
MSFQTRHLRQYTLAALPLGLVVVLFFVTSTIAATDPVAELGTFSVFDKVDLKELATSDVKTAHGPPMSNPRFLSVQSCYVAPGTPAKQTQASRQWDPTKHRELKIFLHSDLPAAPSPANFSRLKEAPDNGPVRAFVSATEKLSPDLQISREEEKLFSGKGEKSSGAIPGPVAKFWAEVLTMRARSFLSGETSAQPPYDHTGEAIRPGNELSGLLKQQEKIRRQFSGFLSETGIGRGAGSLSPEMYWELLDVDDQGVVTLGASYNRAAAGGTVQAAEVLYYASGGYYVALTLYQMWPVSVDGKPSTLVWRGDMISSASLASLHGVEKLASEGAMMKDISKAVTAFRRETFGGR